jgi:hypothetical protein
MLWNQFQQNIHVIQRQLLSYHTGSLFSRVLQIIATLQLCAKILRLDALKSPHGAPLKRRQRLTERQPK